MGALNPTLRGFLRMRSGTMSRMASRKTTFAKPSRIRYCDGIR